MPSNDPRVKDKRICLENALLVAKVEYYQDTPARDEDAPLSLVFGSIPAAQKWLAGFPRDVWDGYDAVDFNYRELDERQRHAKRHTPRQVTVTGEGRRTANREVQLPGRQFAGPSRATR